MAFSELELKRHQKTMGRYIEAHRPPPEIRHQVDLAYRITRQSVEIFELRPALFDSNKIVEESVAKATYVRRAREWRIYWQRADLKWHRYDPTPTVRTLAEFLTLVEQDEYCCFFG